jgi:hypothetical protein
LKLTLFRPGQFKLVTWTAVTLVGASKMIWTRRQSVSDFDPAV